MTVHHMSDGRKIIVAKCEYSLWPSMDWCAYLDDEVEMGGYAYGATEAEALAALIESLEERV